MYLICTTDHLETALFCGTAKECADVLGLGVDTFYSYVSRESVVKRFFKIEKIRLGGEHGE